MFAGMALALAVSAFGQEKSSSVPRSSGSADVNFIVAAAQGGMAEVELGKLAAQQAQSSEVKQFGQRMADDHGRGGDELKSLAQSKGIKLPADLDAKDKALQTRLSKLQGSAFDRAYMRAMVSDHKKDIAEFRHESTAGKDSDVKSGAAKTLPMLEDHLKNAETANAAVAGQKSSN
jgi:putative membrane protein